MVELVQDALRAARDRRRHRGRRPVQPAGAHRRHVRGRTAGERRGKRPRRRRRERGHRGRFARGQERCGCGLGPARRHAGRGLRDDGLRFAARTRHDRPTALAFQLPRADLTAKVHPGVNVRVLELIDEASGSRVELEGNRLPVTHSKDVITALTR
jgi:hypothetical protein